MRLLVDYSINLVHAKVHIFTNILTPESQNFPAFFNKKSINYLIPFLV